MTTSHSCDARYAIPNASSIAVVLFGQVQVSHMRKGMEHTDTLAPCVLQDGLAWRIRRSRMRTSDAFVVVAWHGFPRLLRWHRGPLHAWPTTLSLVGFLLLHVRMLGVVPPRVPLRVLHPISCMQLYVHRHAHTRASIDAFSTCLSHLASS